MFIFQDENGSHVCNGVDDVHKAMGVQNFAKSVIMTDENGQLVGAGQGGDGFMNSMPLVKALREGCPLLKAKPVACKTAAQSERPLHKSLGGFDRLLRDLVIKQK